MMIKCTDFYILVRFLFSAFDLLVGNPFAHVYQPKIKCRNTWKLNLKLKLNLKSNSPTSSF